MIDPNTPSSSNPAFPEGYVRPKRRMPPRPRITIRNLMWSTAFVAIACVVTPFAYLFSLWLAWAAALGLVGAAVSCAKHGLSGVPTGFFAGLLCIPLGLMLLFVVWFVVMFFYIILFNPPRKGMLSSRGSLCPQHAIAATVDPGWQWAGNHAMIRSGGGRRFRNG
ncbi:hypothetical protein SH528x_003472 [Novipirellula sp. SH528]|uniref:hypothetical protein n=1 Tax=Novipirellula sp. SH528 TaxID=3454466 RepID=UPI003F9ED099